MQPIRLPTIPELVARAITGTRFLAEIAARSPHDLRCCAELAAQLAAEQWETETGAPAAETVPHDLTIQVAASLIAHGERHHGPVENALYANEGQLQRSIAALGALQAGIRDTPPLAAAEEALMDVAADRLDEAGAALRGVLALLEAEIDRVERAKASRPRPGAKAIAQIHVASGIRFQTLAAVESTDGMTLLSTFGAADGSGDTELHIPAAARAWLAGVMGRPANSGPMKWWPKLRRKPPSDKPPPERLPDGRHMWSDGWPQRCTRCYQPRYWDNAPCAGRPEPIPIDHGETGPPGR